MNSDNFDQSILEKDHLILPTILNDPIAEAMLAVGLDPGIEQTEFTKEIPKTKNSTEECSFPENSKKRKSIHESIIQIKKCHKPSHFPAFTQSQYLEAAFSLSKYPSREMRHVVATWSNLSIEQVNIWLKGRRARWRREEQQKQRKNSPRKHLNYEHNDDDDVVIIENPQNRNNKCRDTNTPFSSFPEVDSLTSDCEKTTENQCITFGSPKPAAGNRIFENSNNYIISLLDRI